MGSGSLSSGAQGVTTPLFPVPGCSWAAMATSPGNVQEQCLNPLPATPAEPAAHNIPCWSHSRLKQRFTHKWMFSGRGHGECGEGIARERPPLLLMAPLIPAPALPGFVISVLVCV